MLKWHAKVARSPYFQRLRILFHSVLINMNIVPHRAIFERNQYKSDGVYFNYTNCSLKNITLNYNNYLTCFNSNIVPVTFNKNKS